MRFHFDVTQLTTEELLVCFLIKGVQMIRVTKPLAANCISDPKADDGEGQKRDKDSPSRT